MSRGMIFIDDIRELKIFCIWNGWYYMVQINIFWFYQFKNYTDTLSGEYYMAKINMFWFYQNKNNPDIFNIYWIGQHNIDNNTTY